MAKKKYLTLRIVYWLNVQLALQVIVTLSPGKARQLVSEKEDIEASNKNCSASIWGNCAMD